MTRSFTHYWANDTWDLARRKAGTILDYAASNVFTSNGVQSGDRLYVITNLLGVLHVAGRMEVNKIVSNEEAERMGVAEYKANEHALGVDGTRMLFDRPVPAEVVRALRFGKEARPLVVDHAGRIDQQSLRGVRLLSPESAKLLDGILVGSDGATEAASRSTALRPGAKYTRADIYGILGVPREKQGGQWDTGYARYGGEFFVFSNIGTPGRTGHDYGNRWMGEDLYWKAKERSNIAHPSIRDLTDGSHRVHLFTRSADRDPYTYHGAVVPREVQDTVPVTVIWRFVTTEAPIEPGEVRSGIMYSEGTVRTVQVNAFERNTAARAAAIAIHGLACKACEIDFSQVYGALGAGFIHVHHTRQLSEIRGEYEVDPQHDLVPVCPNCHAMLHRQDPPLSVQDLRKVLVAAAAARQAN